MTEFQVLKDSKVDSLKFDDSPKTYFNLLMIANKNLSLAKNSSEAAFCFDRRSRVYFAMGQYRKCWRNLELAKGCGMDVGDLESVKLMEEKASKKRNFFKLSYQENEKNPSLVNCIKLCVNQKYGRYLVTTQRLKSGDIVAIEKPFYKSLDKNAVHGRCTNCFKTNLLDLLPCESCSSAMFCSKECRAASWETFHKFECKSIDEMTQDDGFLMMVQRSLFHALNICGGVENLQKLIEGKSSSSVFDLDFNDETLEVQRKLLLVCHSLEASAPNKLDRIFASSFVTTHEHVKKFWRNESQRDFLITFIIRLIGVMNRNGFTMHWTSPDEHDESGCAIFPSLSLINHSCSPNLFRILVDDKLVFIVRRPINAGEQLFICYQ